MKKLLLVSLLLSNLFAFSQIVNIPDTNFKDAIIDCFCADLDGDGSSDGDVDTNNDGEIQVSEAEAVFGLTIQNHNITSLEGIQSFTTLETLYCGFNDLTQLDVSSNVNLTYLECGNNQLTSLDISSNLALRNLNTYTNQITGIDVSLNTLLESLFIGNNPIANVDISNNLNLEFLDIANCELSNLDVSQNSLLSYLVCANNLLTEIDVSQNPNLDFFVCNRNLLTNLDVSQNLVLRHLNVYDNNLTNLDLSGNPILQKLSAQENQLTSLNIQNGNNFNLVRMFAQDNPELECIQVDDVAFANSQDCIFPTDSWCKDSIAVYSDSCILSTNENELDSESISVYPNPATKNVHISNLGDTSVINLSLINSLGVTILETIGSGSMVIDVSALSQGIYWIRLESGGKAVVKQVIKN